MQKSTPILISTAIISPRLDYVVTFLCDVTGTEFRLVTPEHNNNNKTFIINYNSGIDPGAFNIFSTGLLFSAGIKDHEPDVFYRDGSYFMYKAPPGFDLDFDLFSSVFYLLSRYEEYLPFKPDEYGRFEPKQSLAFRKGFINEPVVDQWVLLLCNKLIEKYPDLVFPKRSFGSKITFDIDNPWAFLHKGWIRTTGGLLKDLIKCNLSNFIYRLSVITGKKKDPFDQYNYILQLEKQSGHDFTFFFLSGNTGKFDTNLALKKKAFKLLLRQLKGDHDIGIHPSYRSNKSFKTLQEEFERFSAISGSKSHISRQHFLMIRFPETYRRLIQLGVEADYSLGYAGVTGFRAGTSLPFRFYDIENEFTTPLILYPFIIMDVTLRQYLNLSPEAAIKHIRHLYIKTREVNGIFTVLWHNESLSEHGEWKGWRKVFEEGLLNLKF